MRNRCKLRRSCGEMQLRFSCTTSISRRRSVTVPTFVYRIKMNKINFVCRCNYRQKCSARHSFEFRTNSTGNFIRRPHPWPTRVHWIGDFDWTAKVVPRFAVDWPHPERILFRHGIGENGIRLLRFHQTPWRCG